MAFAEVLSQSVTRGEVACLAAMPRPSAGTSYFRVVTEIRNGRGIMEDPDDGIVYMRVLQSNGTALASRLFADSAGSAALVTTGGDGTNFAGASGWHRRSASVALGRYEGFFSIASGSTEEPLTIEVGWKENGAVQFASRSFRVGDAADLDTIDSNVVNLQTRLGAGTDVAVAPGSVGSLQAHIREVQEQADTIQTEANKIGAASDAAAAPGAAGGVLAHIREVQEQADTIQTEANKIGTLVNTGGTATLGAMLGNLANSDLVTRLGIGTDAAVAAGSAGSLSAHIRDAQVGIDLMEADLGDFSAGTNLQSLKALLGSLLDTANVPLSDLLGLSSALYKVSAAPTPTSSAFGLTQITGGPGAPAADDFLNGGYFVVLTGTSKGSRGRIQDYAQASAVVTYPASFTLSANDVIAVFMDTTGYVGAATDTAAASDAVAGDSLFAHLRRVSTTKIGNPADTAVDPDTNAGSLYAWLKHIESHVDLIDAGRGPQSSMIKVYPAAVTGVLSGNPTVEDENAANTGDSVTYVVLHSYVWRPPETTAAAIKSIFSDLRCKASATAGAGTSKIKWSMVVASATVTPGSAAPGGTVDISDEITLTTSETEYIRSGLVPSSGAGDAVPATDGVKLILQGKVTTIAQGAITAKVRSNTYLDVHYERS